MQTLVNDIRERLDAMNAFKYIDEDWGQLDDYAPNPPTKWPLALVDIVDAKPSDTGGHVQMMDVTIMVRVAALRLSPSSQRAPSEQRTKSESVFGITTVVHKILHGWHKAGSMYGTLSRVGFRRSRRDDGVREYQILFKTVLKDASAMEALNDISGDVPDVIKPTVSVVAQ